MSSPRWGSTHSLERCDVRYFRSGQITPTHLPFHPAAPEDGSAPARQDRAPRPAPRRDLRPETDRAQAILVHARDHSDMRQGRAPARRATRRRAAVERRAAAGADKFSGLAHLVRSRGGNRPRLGAWAVCGSEHESSRPAAAGASADRARSPVAARAGERELAGPGPAHRFQAGTHPSHHTMGENLNLRKRAAGVRCERPAGQDCVKRRTGCAVVGGRRAEEKKGAARAQLAGGP